MRIQEILTEDTIDKLYRKVIQSQKKYRSESLSQQEIDEKKFKNIEHLMGKNQQIHERHKGAIRNKK